MSIGSRVEIGVTLASLSKDKVGTVAELFIDGVEKGNMLCRSSESKAEAVQRDWFLSLEQLSVLVSSILSLLCKRVKSVGSVVAKLGLCLAPPIHPPQTVGASPPGLS